MRQRPALGVSGTGVTGPSGGVPVTAVHPCMMTDYSNFALGPGKGSPPDAGRMSIWTTTAAASIPTGSG
jgi:hypothetical protein